eukprot:SAG22_NODE_20104_length_268_cov_1.189349_1_plen_79_part_10
MQDDACYNSRNCDVRKFHRGLDPSTSLVVEGSSFNSIHSPSDLGFSAIFVGVGTAANISHTEFSSNKASGACASGGAGT